MLCTVKENQASSNTGPEARCRATAYLTPLIYG
ncbi:hypothetical protein HNO88_004252 [Novosphingobium chloroacetimidivorans]|uniref:Uncharacterized protein n=1 Tax=Novosphingobium chloroacetimidivorans TaxID=1428314 RepID=A0A7W7KDM6_9SPHN|nr:hypothetical protein [Novosphingobium chloroacetimidivorans]